MLQSPRELLARTYDLYRANFWLFIGYAVWLLIPMVAFLILPYLPENFTTFVLTIIALFAQIFISVWMAVSIMKAAALLQNKQTIDTNIISSESVQRITPVLIVALLQMLIILGGMLLLIVPAVIFWVWYANSQVSTAIDSKSPMEALSFSRSLTKDRFFSVLWRLVSGPAVLLLVYAVILGTSLKVIAAIIQVDSVIVFSAEPPLWVSIIQMLSDILIIPLILIYSVLLYEDLKKTLKTPILDKVEAVE